MAFEYNQVWKDDTMNHDDAMGKGKEVTVFLLSYLITQSKTLPPYYLGDTFQSSMPSLPTSSLKTLGIRNVCFPSGYVKEIGA